MNATIPMFKNTQAVQSLRSDGYGSADFDIEEKVLQYFSPDHGHLKSSKKVIYRADTGEELGVHGLGYRPVAPKQMIDHTRTILERSSFDLTGLEETIRTSHNGSRTFVQYRLPEYSYVTPDGDTASLGLLAVSSFDGTWPFMISAAAIQQACTNLQVFVSGEVAVYKAKHTASLDLNRGSNIITNALNVFEKERELWEEYKNSKYTNGLAFQDIVKALDVKSAKELAESHMYLEPMDIIRRMPRQNKALIYIYKKWQDYSRRLGHNKWALYNAFTDWSSHAEATSKSAQMNIASIQHKRQGIVRDAFKRAA